MIDSDDVLGMMLAAMAALLPGLVGGMAFGAVLLAFLPEPIAQWGAGVFGGVVFYLVFRKLVK